MMLHKILLLWVLSSMSFITFAQHSLNTTKETDHTKGNLRIGAAMGDAFIKKSLHGDLNSTTISSAAFAFDADYWLLNKCAVGLHSDLVFENFVVEEKSGGGEVDVIEREHPLAIVPVIIFSPIKHVSVIGGIGEEFSKEKNLTLYRAGVEYGFELPNHWELALSAMYDAKHKSYDTWMLGVGISHWIGLSHKNKR